MTDERKAEVNRRLMEFDGPAALRMYWQYTAHFDALVQLEAKLPPHGWHTSSCENGNIWVQLDFFVDDVPLFPCVANEPTEAEARAEVICRYLETR